MSNATNVEAAASTSDLIVGIVLSIGAGAFIALSMVTQRYALSHESYHIPLCKCATMSRPMLWFVGLVVYGIANGLYATSLMYAPLSLVASLFTLLLVWNLLFARLILGEELTANRKLGSTTIILGAVVSVLAHGSHSPQIVPFRSSQIPIGDRGPVPTDRMALCALQVLGQPGAVAGETSPTDMTVEQVRAALREPLGLSYFVLLLLGILLSTVAILAFERS
jgi:hypothetical protein